VNATTAALGILAGCVAVIVGLMNKRFYWRKGWFSGDKESPRWVGRLLFIGIGAVCILVGLRFFIFGS
jgi:hypothetical protein